MAHLCKRRIKMNDILSAIRTRRSVKKYKSEMPKREDIEAILNAGLQAPSGRNQQGVIIVAITNKEIRDRYAKANADVIGAGGDTFYNAPVIFVVLERCGTSCLGYNGPIALENMMLAAYSLGLGSCWIHRAKEVFERDEWKAWLKEIGIKDECVGIGNLAVGYTDGDYPAPKGINPDRFVWVE